MKARMIAVNAYKFLVTLALFCVAQQATFSQSAVHVEHVSLGPRSGNQPTIYGYLTLDSVIAFSGSLDWQRISVFEKGMPVQTIAVTPPSDSSASCFDLVLLTDNTFMLQPELLPILKETGRILVNQMLPGPLCRQVGLITYDNTPFIRSFLTTNGPRLTSELDAMTVASVRGSSMIDAVRTAQIEHVIKAKADKRYILLTGSGSMDSSRNALVDILPTGLSLHTHPRILTVAIGNDSGADTLRQIALHNGGRYYRAADSNAVRTVHDTITTLIQRDLDEHRIQYLPNDTSAAFRDVAIALQSSGMTSRNDVFKVQHASGTGEPLVLTWPRTHWAVYPDTLRIDSMRYEWCAYVAGGDSTIVLPSNADVADSSITLTADMLRTHVFDNSALNPAAASVVEVHWFVRSRLTYTSGSEQRTVTVTSDTAGVSVSSTHPVPPPLVLSLNQAPVRPDSQFVQPQDRARVYGVDPSMTIEMRWLAAADSNLVHGARFGGFSTYDDAQVAWVRDANRTVDTIRYQWVGIVQDAFPAGSRGAAADTLVFDADTTTMLTLDSTHLEVMFGSFQPDSGADVVRLSWFVRAGDGSSQPLQTVTDTSDLLLTRSQPPLPFVLSTTDSVRNRHLHRMDHVGACVPDSSADADRLVLQWQPSRWPAANGAFTRSDTIRYEWQAEVVRPTPFSDDSGSVRTHSVALPSDANGTLSRITIGSTALRQMFFPHVTATAADSLVAALRWHVRAYGTETGLEVFSDTTGITVGNSQLPTTWDPTPPLVLSYNRPPEPTVQVVQPADGGETFVDIQNPDVRFVWSAAVDSNLIQGGRLVGFRSYDQQTRSWQPSTSRTIDTIRYAFVLTDGNTVLVREIPGDANFYELNHFDLYSLDLRNRDRTPVSWYVHALDATTSDRNPMDTISFRYSFNGVLVNDTARWSSFGCRPHELVAGPFRLDLTKSGRPFPFVLSTPQEPNRDLYRMDRAEACNISGQPRDTLRLHWMASRQGAMYDTVRYEWCAMVDSQGGAAHRVTVESDGGGLQPSLTLPGDRLRTLLYPPDEEHSADSVVLRVRWYVRAFSKSGYETFSDTAGATIRNNPLPTPPLVISINRPPAGALLPVQPNNGQTITGITATTTNIPVIWTPATDINITKGELIGGFKVYNPATQTWVDNASRAVDTLTYQWVGVVASTFPTDKGAPVGTTVVRNTGTTAGFQLTDTDFDTLFAGFDTDPASTSADSVKLDWYVFVKDFSFTDALPMEEVTFRYNPDGTLALDTAMWSRFGCRSHEFIGGPYRVNLTKLGQGGVEIEPMVGDPDIEKIAGEEVCFKLTAKGKDGNIIRNWDQNGQTATITIKGSLANTDTSRRSWSDDSLFYTYAYITSGGVPLKKISANEFMLPESAFTDGVTTICLIHTRADSGVYLETSPILTGLKQTSAKMNFAAGEVTNFLVDLTSATAPTPDQVYLLRRYEIVVSPRDRYLNVVNEQIRTRFMARFPGEFDQNMPGLSDIFNGDVFINGPTNYFLASRIKREKAASDEMQWVRAFKFDDPNVTGQTSPYEVLTHAPNQFALTAPADQTVLKLTLASAQEHFKWVQAVPQDLYTNIQISRFIPNTETDQVTYEVVFLDSASLARERRFRSDNDGKEARLTMTHGWLADLISELADKTTKTLSIVWFVEATDGIFTTRSTPPLNDPSQRNGHGLTLIREGILDVAAVESPTTMELHQNHPNPFSAVTTIAYALPEAGQMRLEVYDMRGAVVRMLVDDARAAGTHTVTWDGRDDRGFALPSGTYLTRLVTGGQVQLRRMTVLR